MTETVDKSRDQERARTLLRRVAAGDERAFSELYDRFSGMLLALLIRMLRDRAEAEEVLQEGFLQAWRQAGRYDSSRSSVSTWLVMLMRSRAIDRIRSRQSRDRAGRELAQEPRVDHTSPEGVGSVLHRERRSRLQIELDRLPPEQKEVLELAFYQGLSQTEIAERTEIPLGTVKTRTLLAMRKLRQALKDEMRELL